MTKLRNIDDGANDPEAGMTATGSQIVRLPPAFWFDHRDRDLPSGRIVKQAKRYIDVEVTPAELAEILSDARFYATSASEYNADYPGLVSSARATVRSIEKIKAG